MVAFFSSFSFVKVAWYFQAPAFRQVSSTLFVLLLSVTCKLFCNNSGNKYMIYEEAFWDCG